MVAGLREREQLRDLFGRHVGEEVVRRAIDANESLSGDERNVAILFIDLVGSTQLAATHEPHEVATVLNEFFRMVVAHVDAHNGLVNKFQGDAVLAVFGAPLRSNDPASAALATARTLAVELRTTPSRFRYRCLCRSGVRRQHRRGEQVRIHRRRRRRQRGRPTRRPRQGLRRSSAVLWRGASSRRPTPNASTGSRTAPRCCAGAPARRTFRCRCGTSSLQVRSAQQTAVLPTQKSCSH